MKTLKLILCAFALMAARVTTAQTSFGEIRGLIKDNNAEKVIGAVVKITQEGRLVGGTQTDENGKYSYKPLNPGIYDMVVTSHGHSTIHHKKVEVQGNQATYIDLKMAVNTLTEVVVTTTFEKPLIDPSMFTIKTVSFDELSHSSVRGLNAMDILGSVSSDMVQDPKGEWHVRGGRTDATEYLVDGVKVDKITGLPNLSIYNMSIISGGVPAMYGDLTSGVANIVTMDYFTGIRAKHMREREFIERQELKARQKADKEEEEKRKKEIEAEKAKEAEGKK